MRLVPIVLVLAATVSAQDRRASASPPEPIVVVVYRDGGVEIESRGVSLDDLIVSVTTARKAKPKAGIVVRVAAGTAAKHLDPVLRVARLSGVPVRRERLWDPIVITRTAKRGVVVGGQRVPIAGVQALVARSLARSGPVPVVVQSSRETPAGALVKLIDAAKKGGAKTVALATDLRQRPQLVHRVNPVLTAALRKLVPARVTVRFVVDEKGSVRDLRVVDSTDARFHKLVLAAVRQWRYLPALRDGKPRRAAVVLPVRLPR